MGIKKTKYIFVKGGGGIKSKKINIKQIGGKNFFKKVRNGFTSGVTRLKKRFERSGPQPSASSLPPPKKNLLGLAEQRRVMYFPPPELSLTERKPLKSLTEANESNIKRSQYGVEHAIKKKYTPLTEANEKVIPYTPLSEANEYGSNKVSNKNLFDKGLTLHSKESLALLQALTARKNVANSAVQKSKNNLFTELAEKLKYVPTKPDEIAQLKELVNKKFEYLLSQTYETEKEAALKEKAFGDLESAIIKEQEQKQILDPNNPDMKLKL